jgi:Ca2+-binding EF-hand superfamily protein
MESREPPTDAGHQAPRLYWENSRLYTPDVHGKRVRIPNTCNNPVTCTFPYIVKKVQESQQRHEADIANGKKKKPTKPTGLPVPPPKKEAGVFEMTEVSSHVPFHRWKRSYEIAPGWMPKMATQDDQMPSVTFSAGKKGSRKDSGKDQEFALWDEGKPKSIADWQKRRRAVDTVHGYMVTQNLPELIENSYYERYEIFQLWARFKCLCTLSSTAYGIDRGTFMEFLEPQMGDEDPVFVRKVFDVVDSDGNGFIDWTEFLQAMSLLEKCTNKDRVMFLFRVINDGCSQLTVEDAKRTFKATITSAEEDVAEKLAESFCEFLREFIPEEDSEGRIFFDDVMRFLDTLPDDFSPYQFMSQNTSRA